MMNDYKQWVSGVFDRAAPNYGEKSSSFFNYFGKRLVEHVNITANQYALDVATGKGAILFPLADAIGPLGKVVGIDISPHMLQETAKKVKERNMGWIDLQLMDAEELDFPENSFDFIFCGFALFFFPAMLKALSEFKRILKPGGKLAVSTWGNDSELDVWISEETQKLCGKVSLVATPLWTERELQITLESALFNRIQTIEETTTFLHDTPEEWWNSLWTHGTRAKFEQLTSLQLVDLREKALKKAKEFDTGNGVKEKLQVFYGIAQK